MLTQNSFHSGANKGEALTLTILTALQIRISTLWVYLCNPQVIFVSLQDFWIPGIYDNPQKVPRTPAMLLELFTTNFWEMPIMYFSGYPSCIFWCVWNVPLAKVSGGTNSRNLEGRVTFNKVPRVSKICRGGCFHFFIFWWLRLHRRNRPYFTGHIPRKDLLGVDEVEQGREGSSDYGRFPQK